MRVSKISLPSPHPQANEKEVAETSTSIAEVPHHCPNTMAWTLPGRVPSVATVYFSHSPEDKSIVQFVSRLL